MFRHIGLWFLGLAFVPNVAFAQVTQGAVQLGLGTGLWSSTEATIEPDTAVDTEIDIATTRYGIGADSNLVLLVGYGLADAMVLGGYLQFGGEDTETTTTVAGLAGEENAESSSFSLGPRFEYMFLDGSLRPFAAVALGYGSAAQDTGTTTLELSGMEMSLGLGLRWFAAPGFSIDPLLQFSYASLSGELDPDGAAASTDLEASGTSIALGVAFSGWL